MRKAFSLATAVCFFNLAGGSFGETHSLLAFIQPRQAQAETAPAAAQPQSDGPQLLDKHCLNCHVIEKITHYRKSREQWAQTLANMIKNDGVVLTEAEQTVLLDYFVSLKKPDAKAP